MRPGAIIQFDRGPFEPRGRHLASQCAVVDQFIQARVIAGCATRAVEIGRPDRLVRFLRILDLALILPRLVGHEARIVATGNRLPRGADRFGRHVDAVGPHVGDEAVFVETLSHTHRVAGREAELARGLLLQRRGCERRRRVSGERLGLDRGDREPARLDRGLGGVGIAAVADRQPVDLFAVELDQPRGKASARRLRNSR